jgi:hypothetical protein
VLAQLISSSPQQMEIRLAEIKAVNLGRKLRDIISSSGNASVVQNAGWQSGAYCGGKSRACQ